MPKVSVIIPAYNAAKHLPSTLDSVLTQIYRDFETIVVDDGSTDETVEVLKAYGDRIRWAVRPHQGQAYAINHGIRMSAGEYLTYLDADDLFLPTKLEVQARHLDEHPESDVVYSDMYRTDPVDGTVLMKYRSLDPFYLLQYCCVSRITVMHRRTCLDRIGLFNEHLTGSDDWDMWVRMSEACRMDYMDQPLAEYRIHGSNTHLTRRKKMDHTRWTHVAILEGACRRRGRPFWLRVMVFNARIQWLLGKTPYLGEHYPRLWNGANRVRIRIERLLLHRMATPPRLPDDPKPAALPPNI